MKWNWQCAEQEGWGHMTDKIILFLVEGPTDEDALALIYSRIVKKHDIKSDCRQSWCGRKSPAPLFYKI